MTMPIVLIGGGEHARVVAEAVRSHSDRFCIVGFVDPHPCTETVERLGLQRLGEEDALAGHPEAYGVIAVGMLAPGDRRAVIAARLDGRLAGWASVAHAHSWISPTAVLEPGAVVMAGAVVQTGARIGTHAIVNSSAVIEHDVQVGAFTHIAPGVAIGGGTVIGERSVIGLGARIRDHVRIGNAVQIGMGAVVVHDIPDGARVKGVPAR
jgi:acetyltransferase EpsM